MFGSGYSPMQHTFCRCIPIVLAAAILLPVIAAAQQPQPAAPNPHAPSVLKIRSDVLAGVRRITPPTRSSSRRPRAIRSCVSASCKWRPHGSTVWA